MSKSNPILGRVLAYWEELRAGRVAPLRSEVNPRDMEDALENAFILEKVGPGIIRYRLAGMALNDLMGMEVRGMPAIALFEAEDRDRAEVLFDGVFSVPEILDLTLTSELRGCARLTGRLLALPLRDDTGILNRALGCVVIEGRPGLAPRRFRITKTQISRIESSTTTERPKRRHAAGFAEPAASYSAPSLRPLEGGGKGSRRGTPPKLRLVQNDED